MPTSGSNQFHNSGNLIGSLDTQPNADTNNGLTLGSQIQPGKYFGGGLMGSSSGGGLIGVGGSFVNGMANLARGGGNLIADGITGIYGRFTPPQVSISI